MALVGRVRRVCRLSARTAFTAVLFGRGSGGRAAEIWQFMGNGCVDGRTERQVRRAAIRGRFRSGLRAWVLQRPPSSESDAERALGPAVRSRPAIRLAASVADDRTSLLRLARDPQRLRPPVLLDTPAAAMRRGLVPAAVAAGGIDSRPGRPGQRCRRPLRGLFPRF